MHNEKDLLDLKPDFEDSTLEETAEFPENVAEHKVDDSKESVEVINQDEPNVDPGGTMEEIGDIAYDFTESSIIIDDYPEIEELSDTNEIDKSSDEEVGEMDISALAAEIDSLTVVNRSEPENIDNDIDAEIAGIEDFQVSKEKDDATGIVIFDDDEIDLDYYSLEEIEQKGVQTFINLQYDESIDFQEPGTTAIDEMDEATDESLADIPLPDEIDDMVTIEEPILEDEKSAQEGSDDRLEELESELPENTVGSDKVFQKEASELKKKKDENLLTFEIPKEIREKLVGEFKIEDLGSIDLKEAEEIANESVLVLNENDLIEALEEFQITPLKDKDPEATDGEPVLQEAEEPDIDSVDLENQEQVEVKPVSETEQTGDDETAEKITVEAEEPKTNKETDKEQEEAAEIRGAEELPEPGEHSTEPEVEAASTTETEQTGDDETAEKITVEAEEPETIKETDKEQEEAAGIRGAEELPEPGEHSTEPEVEAASTTETEKTGDDETAEKITVEAEEPEIAVKTDEGPEQATVAQSDEKLLPAELHVPTPDAVMEKSEDIEAAEPGIPSVEESIDEIRVLEDEDVIEDVPDQPLISTPPEQEIGEDISFVEEKFIEKASRDIDASFAGDSEDNDVDNDESNNTDESEDDSILIWDDRKELNDEETSSQVIEKDEDNKAPESAAEFDVPWTGKPVITEDDYNEANLTDIPEYFIEDTFRYIDGAKSETIPPELMKAGIQNPSVRFVDDGIVENQPKRQIDFTGSDELDRITSDIVETIEGSARILREAGESEDLEKISSIMRGTAPTFEDLLIDLDTEFSFQDEEMDIIDNSFIMEDYYKYLRSIDDLTESKTGKEKPAAFEILGLNYDELASIENNVFRKEYEKINLEEVLKISQIGLDQPKDDYKLLRCDYIKQAMSSLGDDEKSSIEEDIKSKTALVFEEDIDEIEERLHYQKMKTDEIPEGELHDDDNTGVQDISDKVVIIDDENDLQRYIESFPADKQANLKRLLKYLDGLFEKLPEDVINNFANSEYFELYSKVLDDLDV